MSASREKHIRQEQANAGWVDPKITKEAEQRKKEQRNNTLYAIIGIAFVLVLAVSLIWRSNIIAKTATAATIDGEKYTASEVNFYYQNVYMNFMTSYSEYLSVLGLNPNATMDSQEITEGAASMLGIESGITWHEYFLSSALEQMTLVQRALQAAEAEGYVYSDSVQENLNTSLESMKTSAEASGVSLSSYLQSLMGPTMTESVYEEQMLRICQYSDYLTAFTDGLTYSEEELEQVYAEDPKSYDKVAYEVVSISGAVASEETEEMTEEEAAAAREAAKKAAKEAADQMLADYKAGKSLEKLAEANENAFYTNDPGSSYYGIDLMDWLFDDARKDGDATVVESGSSYFVAVFHDRFREEYNSVSVRHILLPVDDTFLNTASETYEADLQALKDETLAKAEELLAQWKAGEATEESFAQMANEHSVDDGSNTTGGLYYGFAKGQMVPEFNDWCFDASRKSGDTGIVYGESPNYKGYHIMYFVSTDEPFWQLAVSSVLMDEAYSAWYEELVADPTIERHALGMKFVG